MILNDESDFFPEQVEDLMTKKNDKVTEIVQVKNLSLNLSLSHLSPKESDSFFQRCLQQKNNSNEEVVLRVVSFGTIGEELKAFCESEYTPKLTVVTKLLSYGYSKEEVEWIHSHLKVEHVDEEALLFDIYQLLEGRVHTMASPQVALDILINYIANLSRRGTYTSKQIWEQKMEKIATDLASMSSMANQFGRTIFPIYEYKDIYNYEVLKAEYSAGINAMPQHIRANLDFPRKRWINLLNNAVLASNIVIVRGASGQGKSTIAYRYLLDQYLERDILCIEKVISEKQAVDICAALQGMARERKSTLIVYMDVAPYDVSWLWICEQLQAHGTELKLIITMREEDFRRSPIDYSKHMFIEVEIQLSEEEAQELFDRYPSGKFLSFGEAWKSFGEAGPLMEFTYMLHEQKTIRDKLKAQVNRITQQEANADDWLQILEVVSYLGKHNLKVNTKELFEKFPVVQRRKMLSVFEKEYFLRVSNDKKHLESLHALRASILYDILKEESLFSELDNLKLSLQIIEDVPLMLVVEFFYENEISFNVIKVLATIKYNSWSVYAGVLKAVLWGEVYTYYWLNKVTIDIGNELINNFVMFGITDVTGYLKNIDFSFFEDILEKNNSPSFKEFIELKSTLKSTTLSYELLDSFITESISTLPFDTVVRAEDLTAMGFSLYWFSLREHLIPEHDLKSVLPDMNLTNLDDYLNLLVGLNHQNWFNNYDRLRKLAERIIFPHLSIVYCNVSNEVTAYAIYNILENEDPDFNSRILRVVDSVRKLYPQKQRYNVEILGQGVIDNIDIPNLQKHIPIENLPFVWVTQLNRWLNSIDKYLMAPVSWDNVHEEILQIKSDINSSVDFIIRGVDYLYNKKSTKRLLETKKLDSRKIVKEKLSRYTFPTPQCALDQYGIKLNNAIVDRTNGDMRLASIPQKNTKEFKSIWNNFCNSYLNYLNQMDTLLIAIIKQEEVPDKGRLSLINLITAYQEMDGLENRFKEEMSKYSDVFFTKEERDRILLLTAMWTKMYKHSLQKTSSLSYDSNLYISKYRKRLEKFFSNDIFEHEGVISGDKNGKRVRILVNAQQAENFCRELFTRFRQEFSEVSTLTLEESIFKDYVQLIEIIVSFNGQNLPGGYSIENQSLVIYEDVEKFISMLLPSLDTHGIVLEDSPKTSALKIFAVLHALPMLFKYSAQVHSRVSTMNASDFYIMSVYENWLVNLTNYLIRICEELISHIQTIKVFRKNVNVLEIEVYEETILNVLTELKSNAKELLVTEDIDEVINIFVDLENTIISLIDLYPKEFFE